ncbi:MAG: vitamin B12-dependent ribonucleotide reductase [Thermodesulfobacteriota bacterium]
MTALSANAQFVLRRRYLRKNDQGEVIETPGEMFRRVARAVAQADEPYGGAAAVAAAEDRFVQLMEDLDFLPNSPTLMNAGRRLGQLAACFVLPVEDSIEDIFETLKHTAIIHKSGGGTGFSFSRLRPARSEVRSTRGVSSGPVSFMRIFDIATETIKQGGARRGANMAVLRVDHPDIEAFIAAKEDPTALANFNLSVAVTDDFMARVKSGSPLPLVAPHTGQAVAALPAAALFDRIAQAAWQGGEPGLIFIDRINRASTLPGLGPIEATNPCGEQPLLPYESCNLGSLSLSRFLAGGRIDYDRLAAAVATAVHFLDNVIDVNVYPLPAIAQVTLANRKIGLGVMGFADLLIGLGIPYDSEAAVRVAEEVMGFIDQEAKRASASLAKERGNFPSYRHSIWNRPETPFMRNATQTTVAPTGTLSIIAGCSSGIEPLFALAFTRHILDGERLPEVHAGFQQRLEAEGLWSEALQERVLTRGRIGDEAGLPAELTRLFATALEVAPAAHIRIQAAFQRHTDNAVSKTINFPAESTQEQIRDAYWLAHEEGLKGLTIYRYGSRREQVLSVEAAAPTPDGIGPRPRPSRTYGLTERLKTGCGNLYVTVNSDQKGVCEVFASMGKTGGCASSQIEAIGRLTSLALRSGVSLAAIGEQLAGIRCPSPMWQNGEVVLSCPDAVAKVVAKITGDRFQAGFLGRGACPDCGGPLDHEEGCLACRACGFSRCL